MEKDRLSGREDLELADLLGSAIAGDERCYTLFLERVAIRVRAYVRARLSQGGVDPEDVVQETLLAIHLKRHTWMPGAAVMLWVYAIARFKLIDAFRRRERRVEIDVEAWCDDPDRLRRAPLPVCSPVV